MQIQNEIMKFKVKKFSYPLFLVLFFLMSIHGVAQNKSKLDEYLDQSRAWQKQNNMDSLRFYASKAMVLAAAENQKKSHAQAALLMAQGCRRSEPREALPRFILARALGIEGDESAVQFRADLTLGSIYGDETKYDSTKYYYDEALKIATRLLTEDRSTDNLRRMGMIYNNFGVYYINIEQLPKAVYYVVETEKIGRELKDTAMMFRSAVNAGAIYNELGSPENKVSTGYTQKMFLKKAIEYFKIAYDLLNPEVERYRASIYNNMGIAYLNLGQYDSARVGLERALEFHKKGDDKERLCSCQDNLGGAYYKLELYDKAGEAFDASINMADSISLKSCLISALSNKGQLLTHQNKLEEAEAVLKRALALKNAIKGSHENYLLYEKFYLLYEKKNDFKNAFEYYRLFVGARDSVADVEHLNLLDEIEVRYGTEKKDEKISELNLENQLLEERNRTREAQLRLREFWIASLLIFVLMAALIVWFWVQRNRLKHQQEAVDLEHRLLRARMNPHFLFNGLNTIQKHYADGASEMANQFMADFSKFLRLILNKTGETKHTLSDEIEFTELYASLEQRKYPDKINFRVEIDPTLETEQWMVPSLLLQPIVENAIWHGILPTNKPGEIVMKLYENKREELVCEITDNGIGYDSSMKQKDDSHVSKAFELIQKRLGKNGSVEINTLKENGQSGTRITITMNSEI